MFRMVVQEIVFAEWVHGHPEVVAGHVRWVGAHVRPLAQDAVPPQPDAGRMPILHAHWTTMFGGAAPSDPEPIIDPPLFRRPLLFLRGKLPADTPDIPSPRGEGDNWCGAVLGARGGHRYTEVVGRWRVPQWAPGERPRPPADAVPAPRASAWIGLDGSRQCSDNMPQMGVVFGPPGSAPSHPSGDVSLWFQWWVRNEWTPPLWLKGIDAEPGDMVACTLRLVSHTRVHAWIRVRDRLVGLEADAPHGRTVAGASAEWIAERPSDPTAADLRAQMHLLPDFTSITFEGCAARLAATPGEDGQEVALRNARRPRMTQRLNGPRRTIVGARAFASAQAPGRLRVMECQWRGGAPEAGKPGASSAASDDLDCEITGQPPSKVVPARP